MGRLFLFELKKSMKSSKNILLWLILILMLSGYVIYNANLNKDYRSDMQSVGRSNIWSSILEVNNLLEEYDEENPPVEIQEQLDFWRKDQYMSASILVYSRWVGADKWRDVLKSKIRKNNNMLVGMEKGYIASSTKKDLELEKQRLENENRFHQFLLDHDIKPLDSKYLMTAYNFLYRALQDLFPTIVVMIILLVGADAFSSESEMGSYKYLLLQPIKRTRVFLAKSLACFVNSFTIVFSSFAMVFLGTGLTNGFGEAKYPIAYDPSAFHGVLSETNKTGTLHYLSMGNFLIRAIVLSILFIVFLVSLTMLISSLTDNTVSAMCIVVGMEAIITMFLAFIEDMKLVSFLLPFTYSNPVNVLSGKYYGTALMGIVVLCLSSTLLYIIGSKLFRGRDIVC